MSNQNFVIIIMNMQTIKTNNYQLPCHMVQWEQQQIPVQRLLSQLHLCHLVPIVIETEFLHLEALTISPHWEGFQKYPADPREKKRR